VEAKNTEKREPEDIQGEEELDQVKEKLYNNNIS
jgi:hypothetical protein